METLTKLLLVVCAVILVGSSSCSLTKGRGIAEAAVTQFHSRYNAGQFHEIYVDTDEGFRKVTSEADLVALLEALRRKLGTVNQSNQGGWRVNATTTGTMVSLGYNVDFSEGKGTEEFVFHVSGDKAMLFNYHVNSPLLITK
jgi:hypothetical protein